MSQTERNTLHDNTINGLLKALILLEDTFDNVSEKDIEYNNDLCDEIQVKYFGNDADGDRQEEYATDENNMTYAEAKEALQTRITNLLS